MPKFATVSPTHVPGKKEYAWNNFRTGAYVAIGETWLHEDLSGKSMVEVADIIRASGPANETSDSIDEFEKLFSLSPGDYIAVNNTNDGLFGAGVVKSGYHFQKYKHDTGSASHDEFYSHFIEVEWKLTTYVRRVDIIQPGETSWRPYGTINVLPQVPSYIWRILGVNVPLPVDGKATIPQSPKYIRPDWLLPVIQAVEVLHSDPNHQERAHESLVEDFFCALGYSKHQDIKYRQGRVDVTIGINERPCLLAEVKRNWDMSLQNSKGAIQQVYVYALEQGVRHVVATNGDVYLLFDRLQGLSYESNFLGEFQLTTLTEGDLETIDRLKRESLEHPNLEELFKHLSEAFPS